MKPIVYTVTIAAALCITAYSQTSGAAKTEFEVASIKAANPSFSARFHATDALTGGPGTSDPGMFRCTCTVAALIVKAFDLQWYQLPESSSLPAEIFDVSAKVPAGTTREQFSLMLQSLLKDRFGLVWHFDKKEMQGYQLVVAKGGSKLKESQEGAAPSGEAHGGFAGHSGTMAFGGMGRYRGDHRTTADLAHALSNQILKPVDDQTGLTGKYDISLSWSSDVTHEHAEGAGFNGGGGHGDHAGSSAGGAGDIAGLTVFDALQAQLGLKLVATKKAVTPMLIVDHVAKVPTMN